MTSLWVGWRLKSPASRLFTQPFIRAQIKKHQSPASLAFVRGIHRRRGNSPHKWPVTRKLFPFDDAIMYSIKTEFWRNTSITCISNVKRLRITKFVRISLQDMCINLVVISHYAALNWRDSTSGNMGYVRRWLRKRFPHIMLVVHNFPVIEEAETCVRRVPPTTKVLVVISFDVFFDLHLNKWLSKQSWGWWFETTSRQLWRHCNDY